MISCIHTGVELSVKTVWMMALALKSLVQAVKARHHTCADVPALFKSSFVRSMSRLAMQGTAYSQHWSVTDLEVNRLYLLTYLALELVFLIS